MKLLYIFTIGFFVSASAYVFFGNAELFGKGASSTGFVMQAGTPDHGSPGERARERRRPVHALYGAENAGAGGFAIPGPVVYGVKTVDKASAAPGETLTYSVVISNTGADAATDVAFSDDIDANTTLVAGSLKASPIASDDQYSCLGNVGISVPAGNGILANDYLGLNPAAAFTPVTDAATTGGGTISIGADGAFTYTPAAGYAGDDTYAYTLTNSAGSSNGTIRITVSGITWFINNNYSGTLADGRLATPFKTLNDFQAVNDGVGLHPGDNQVIFVFESATGYTGNLSLRSGQKLIGQDASTTLPGITGYTTPTYNSPALPVLNSGNATYAALAGVTASTPVVRLNGGGSASYTVRGLRIGDRPADAASAAIAGTSFGTLNVSEVSISGTGQALLLNTGTVNGSIASVSSSSGASGISLTTIGGSLAIDGGSLSGNGTGLFMNGGTGSLTYDGTITGSTVNLVNIQAKTGGTVDLNGAISSGAGSRGVSLSNNSSTTVNFDGGLALATGANSAFTAVNASIGGTLNITQDNSTIINTITTTTGVGIQITNMNIGSSGVSFRSVSVNGSTTRGIGLDHTGTGAFTVSGVGTTAGSGGTIQNVSLRGIEIISAQQVSLSNLQLTNANTTDGGGAGVCDEANNGGCNAAVYLKDVTGVSLTQVNITNTVEEGINMLNVSGLAMNNCTVQGNGDASEEGALKIRNFSGTCTISNSLFKNSAFRIAHIVNTTGNVHLSISGSSFINDASNTSLIKQDCFEMRTQNAATATLLISNSTFKRAGTKGIQVFAENTSTINMAVTGSSIDRDGQLMAGVEVGSDQTAVMNANVDGNSLISGSHEVPLNVYSGTSSTMQATVRNNTSIQGGNDPNVSNFSTLRGFADQQSGSKILFTNNVVSNIDVLGIEVATSGNSTGGSISGQVGSNTVNSNNVVGNQAIAGIRLSAYGPTGTYTTCGYVNNNSVSVAPGTDHFRVTTGSATSILQLQGTGTSAAGIWDNNGNSPTSATATIITQQFPGSTITYGGVTCPLPTNTSLPTLIALKPAELVPVLVSTEAYQAKEDLPSTDDTATQEVEAAAVTAEAPPVKAVPQIQQSVSQLLSGENVTVSGLTLPAGKSVTISFQVTVNDPFPDGVCSVSNQGSISGSNFTTVLTDDDNNSGNGVNPTLTTIPVAASITACQDNIDVNTDAGECSSLQSFGVTATGCPEPTVTYTIHNTATTITSPYAFPAGVTTVDVSASNGVGSAATCSFTVTVTDPAPVISSVSVPATGYYKLGDNLSFTVNFDGAVVVTGTPLLPLTIGSSSKNASYVSGSGTSVLSFSYTVGATDYDDDGISVGSSLNLNGGSIQNGCGTDAVLALNGVGATTGVLVDGVVPTVTVNQATGQADPTSDATIYFTAVFSEPVTGFTDAGVTLTTTTGATLVSVSEASPNDGTTYTIGVSGMTTDGTVSVSGKADAAFDAAGNGNTTSTSTDNTVNWVACHLTCPGNISVSTSAGSTVCGANVNFEATTTGNCGTITYEDQNGHAVSPGGFFPKGTTTVTATAGGSQCSFSITVNDGTPPTISCPVAQTVNADADCQGTIPDLRALAVVSDNCTTPGDITVTQLPAPGTVEPLGQYTITLTAEDEAGNSNFCTTTVTVRDNTAPVFTTGLTASPVVLWPPDHRLRDITLSYTTADNCSSVNNVISVTSTDPISGVADGDKFPDWIVVNDHLVQLRAERGNGKEARVYTITVTPVDAYGNEGTPQSVLVRVSHNITAPFSGSSFKVGSTVGFAGVFWDVPGNTHTAQWLIDDNTYAKGAVTEPSGNKNGKVSGSYKFTTAGVYRLQMNVTDQDKVTSYCNTNEDMEAIVVIYDPNGGYAYGGGSFNSPAGALSSDPSATGKASYGFTLNYFKNATNPKGETQFQFKVGDLEYNALTFDYLSVSKYKAVFRGTGKIIGQQSGIDFMMYVVDGALDGTRVDKIRMKIFNRNTGEVYYDNQQGASDADDPVMPVNANSTIVIGGGGSSGSGGGSGKPGGKNQRVMSTEFAIASYPNPSYNSFNVVVNSSNITDKIYMSVTDMLGRVVERRVVLPLQTVNIGAMYRPGVYLVQVMQGNEKRQLKLSKIPE